MGEGNAQKANLEERIQLVWVSRHCFGRHQAVVMPAVGEAGDQCTLIWSSQLQP